MTMQEYITYYIHTAVPLIAIPQILILVILSLAAKVKYLLYTALIFFLGVLTLWFSGPHFKMNQLNVDSNGLNWIIFSVIVSVTIWICSLKLWAKNDENKLKTIYAWTIFFLVIYCFIFSYCIPSLEKLAQG